jgi:acetyl-CoA carboxylase biotin carboxyl carrier protein
MGTEISFPMAGAVARVMVNVGDTVEMDDEVIVIEAMKMENPIYTPTGGVVKEIIVPQGKPFEANQALMIIE